jgi:DNA-binding PucR family transcriptional regulator
MDSSKAIYAKVRGTVSAEDGYDKLISEPEKRNADLMEVSNELDTVHLKQAPEVQKKLELLIADKSKRGGSKQGNSSIRSRGRQECGLSLLTRRVSNLSHGVRNDERRLRRRCQQALGPRAAPHQPLQQLLAHSTRACRGAQEGSIEVLKLKNKYALPTPMGYSDFNSCASVVLSGKQEGRVLCEIQSSTT